MEKFTRTANMLLWGDFNDREKRLSEGRHFAALAVNLSKCDVNYDFYKPGGQAKINLRNALERAGLYRTFYLS